MPSVIRPAGTVSSIQAKAAISVGEIAKPDRKRNAASAANPSHERQRQHQQPEREHPQPEAGGVRWPGGAPHRRSRRTPGCRRPRRRASARTGTVAPSSSESATVATSAPPSTAPMVKALAISGASTCHGIGARACPWRRREAGGSVRFWLTRSAVPARVAATAEASPASGCTVVASVGHQGRSDDEDHLVDDRLEGEGGEEVALVLDQVRPAGPHGGADLRQRRHRPRRRTGAATAPAAPPRRRPSSRPARGRRGPPPPAAPGSDRAGR